MLEAGTMLLFCAVLFASVALGWSIIPALFVGVLLFCLLYTSDAADE